MSVSETARSLHIAQPTLSNHIAALEKEFDCKLVVRGKKTRLTASGRELVNYASEMLDTFERMKGALLEAQTKERTVIIALENNANCSHMNFTRLATEFMVANRDVYMQMDYTLYPNVSAALDNDADCAITCMRPIKADEKTGVVFKRLPDLLPHRLLLWVDARNPLAERKSLKWSDLDGKYPMSAQNPIWAAGCIQTLEDHGISAEVRTNAQEDLNNLLAVREDEFVLLDEQTAISSFIAAIPNHVLVPIDEPDAYCYSYLAYRPENVSEGLQAFIDHIDKVASL